MEKARHGAALSKSKKEDKILIKAVTKNKAKNWKCIL